MSVHAKQKPFREAIERVLKEHGITVWQYVPGGKHMRCEFVLPGGKVQFTMFPSTGGEYRGALNKASEVRRQLAALGVPKVKK